MSAFCSMLLFKTSLFSTFWVIFPIWQKQLKIALGQGWKTYIFRFYALCQVEVTAYCIIVVNGSTKKLFSIDCVIVLSSLYRSNFNICVAVANTAFSPLGGPMCPHKKKKKFFLPLANPHGIFAAGGTFVSTQEKKNFFLPLAHGIFATGRAFMPTQEKKNFFCRLSPRHFRRWGSLSALTRKKTFAAGRTLVLTQE